MFAAVHEDHPCLDEIEKMDEAELANVDVYVTPGRINDSTLVWLRDLGVLAGVTNYHGSSYETSLWDYEEAIDKLADLEERGFPKNMVTMLGSEALRDALRDRGWSLAGSPVT